MTYRYELDELSRVIDLLPDEEVFQHLPSIEVENNFPFRSHFYKVKSGKLVEFGHDEEYIQEQAIVDKEARIRKLKQMLSDSDWKVVVNAELIQAGLKAKYPNLHTERQAWRDEINLLEG
jgi:hypothetical protein